MGCAVPCLELGNPREFVCIVTHCSYCLCLENKQGLWRVFFLLLAVL